VMVAPVDMVLLTKPPQEESVLERFHPLKNFMWTALSDKLTPQTLFLSLTPTVTLVRQAHLLMRRCKATPHLGLWPDLRCHRQAEMRCTPMFKHYTRLSVKSCRHSKRLESYDDVITSLNNVGLAWGLPVTWRLNTGWKNHFAMEEVSLPQPSQTIDLMSEDSLREVQLTLTVGQIKLIHALIEQNIQPKGYEMIKLVYELFGRLKIPELFSDQKKPEPTPTTEEAFEWVSKSTTQRIKLGLQQEKSVFISLKSYLP
jgi:hypothetical protein